MLIAFSLFLCCERSFTAIRNQAGGDVRNPHRGIGGIDVLSTFAAGAVGVNPYIVGLDVDFDAIVNFRRNINAGERGMPGALRLIEGKFAGNRFRSRACQIAECILADHRKCRRLDSRFFAWPGSRTFRS